MTYDVDLVVPTTAVALGAIDALLSELGRVPAAAPIAVTYTDPRDPLREVDILVSPPIDPTELVTRAVTLLLDDIPVRVVSIADLIALKRSTGRAQDAADVAHLERLTGGRDG